MRASHHIVSLSHARDPNYPSITKLAIERNALFLAYIDLVLQIAKIQLVYLHALVSDDTNQETDAPNPLHTLSPTLSICDSLFKRGSP